MWIQTTMGCYQEWEYMRRLMVAMLIRRRMFSTFQILVEIPDAPAE